MSGNGTIIKYLYRSKTDSRKKVSHAFNYISAVTGYRFVFEPESPELWSDYERPAADSVRIILGAGGRELQEGWRGRTGDSGKDIIYIENDPIREIISMLSVESGSMSDGQAKGKTGKTSDMKLSGQLRILINVLVAAGLIDSSERAIGLWPEEKMFGVVVTHDIDIIRRSIRGSVKLLVKRDVPGGFRGLKDSILAVSGRSCNPYDCINGWIDLEESLGLKSTYFVFSGARKEANDPKYTPEELRHRLSELKASGHEIALHTGIRSHSGDGIGEAGEILKAVSAGQVEGLRPHYLSVSLPEYWRTASEKGFRYSSCLGFDDSIGYYGGIDLPIVPFDNERDCPINIIEIPIVIMDCGLIGEGRAESDETFRRGADLIDGCRNDGGILTLDWHQRTLYQPDYPGWSGLMEKLIDYAIGEGGCFYTMRDMAVLMEERMRRFS